MFIGHAAALLSIITPSFVEKNYHRAVAITIDDLPYVGASKDFKLVMSNTIKLLDPLRKAKIPVTGFVIGGGFDSFTPDQKHQLYRVWLSSGAQLGNHTWTHANLDQVGLEKYEEEILRTDADLKKFAGQSSNRYFRAPYLNDGKDLATKSALKTFLTQHQFVEAPVTLDSDEYKFAGPYDDALNAHNELLAKRIEEAYVPYWRSLVIGFEKGSKKLFGHECAQIYLIHANRLTANTIPRLIQMFHDRGYQFISLNQALKDPVYRTPDLYVGSGGYSWLYRWLNQKGIQPGPWIEPPSWLRK